MSTTITSSSERDTLLLRVSQFVIDEAELADGHQYQQWLDLWAPDDELIYWVPAQHDDPVNSVSIICDNRARLKTRIAQLISGQRYSQAPPSDLSRVAGGINIITPTTDGIPERFHHLNPPTISATTRFVLIEHRHETQTIWAGRSSYLLEPNQDTFHIRAKRVDFVNRTGFLPTMSFIA